MYVRGLRGAITIPADQPEEIHAATSELLDAILADNPSLRVEDVASVIFTVTPDIQSSFPASAARQLGWESTPLMCAMEIPVPGSLPLCIRLLLHWNTELPQSSIKHVYLRGAASLRPDLVKRNENR
jgi:chorismate mutase